MHIPPAHTLSQRPIGIVQVVAAVNAAAVPVLEGAKECAAGGFLSSLHAENARVAAAVQGGLERCDAALLAVLVDPQTGALEHERSAWLHRPASGK